MIENEVENEIKNGPKMVTVNTLGRKNLKNEAKMHFAYHRQCSAHSSSTPNDTNSFFFAQVRTHKKKF
jgi:hypothetical protein